MKRMKNGKADGIPVEVWKFPDKTVQQNDGK